MIPYNKPYIVGKELYNIAEAVISNSQISGDGKFTKSCQLWFEKKLRCGKALLTHSCTAALEMTAILCDIQPGDEVIMPSFTFVSTANAFVLRGGVPVFIDIKESDFNLDESLLEEAITDKTRAIVPVHYGGTPCAMDTICDLAQKHNLLVIEDAAQALLATHGKEYLGSIGDFGTLSFHETKNVISGEGGALLINNSDYLERAECIWEKGTNRKKFSRGEVDKYTWLDIGSSFLPSELTAAFLFAQLEHAETIILTRRKLLARYRDLLQPLVKMEFIRFQESNIAGNCNGHICSILTRSMAERNALISFLSDKGIKAIFHYIPLHSSPAGLQFAKTGSTMNITNMVSECLVRLPLFFDMSAKDVAVVCDHITQFYK